MHKFSVIDCHAHIFPDKISEKAVAAIGDYYNIKMNGSGTFEDLLLKGQKINADKFVIHSTASKQEQVTAVNDFINEVMKSNDKFIGFGTLHPDFPDLKNEFERILSLGLKGIKLHPEFQGFSIDDESMFEIYSLAENKLPVLMHMGDINFDSSSPIRLLKIIEKFPALKVIAAHLGGFSMWDKSRELLAGKNIYLDTSSSLAFLKPIEAVEIIRKHGSEKVLFGTDYPVWRHDEELQRFLGLGLDKNEVENILWKNAVKLFGL